MTHLEMMTEINKARVNTTLSIMQTLRLPSDESSEFFSLIDNRLTLMLDQVLAIVNAQDNGQSQDEFHARQEARS